MEIFSDDNTHGYTDAQLQRAKELWREWVAENPRPESFDGPWLDMAKHVQDEILKGVERYTA